MGAYLTRSVVYVIDVLGRVCDNRFIGCFSIGSREQEVMDCVDISFRFIVLVV